MLVRKNKRASQQIHFSFTAAAVLHQLLFINSTPKTLVREEQAQARNHGHNKTPTHNCSECPRKYILLLTFHAPNTQPQYLLALTALASYALHTVNALSLPIANATTALIVALPLLSGIALSSILTFQRHLTRRGQLQTSRLFQTVIAAFLILEAVLATLAGIHISPPGSLDCALRERWRDLFRAKDGKAIQRIQDALHCCGLLSPRDMAFPFPDSRHGSEGCVVRYERERSCLRPWSGMERKVAVVLLVVVIAVFAWKVSCLFAFPAHSHTINSHHHHPHYQPANSTFSKITMVLAPCSGSAWLPSTISLPTDTSDTDPSTRNRQVIEYRDLENAAADDDEDDNSLRAEVMRRNDDSTLVSHIESGRVRPSPLRQQLDGDDGGRGEARNNVWAGTDGTVL